MNLTCLMTDQLRRIHTWQIRREDVPSTCSRQSAYKGLRIVARTNLWKSWQKSSFKKKKLSRIQQTAFGRWSKFRKHKFPPLWSRFAVGQGGSCLEHSSQTGDVAFKRNWFFILKKTQTKKDELHHRLTINKYWLVVSLY